jgi:uncharacterized protein involved in exopolysaccharide biosynthesis
MVAAMDQPWVDDETIDLRAVVAYLWRQRVWIITSVLLFTTIFVAIALLSKPVYRAATIVIPTSSERGNLSRTLSGPLSQIGGLASLAGINLGNSDSMTEEALAVLESRQFTERFIVDFDLMPILFESEWDQERGRWRSEAEDDQPTLARGAAYFANDIRVVTRDQQSGLITVQIDWYDREAAANWANELVARLNAEMRARAIEKTEASLEFLEKELEATSIVGTREAINRLIENQISERMLANVTHEFAFRVVDSALPPDKDDPVRPNKLLLFAAGPVLGFVLAVVMVLVWLSLKDKRTHSP